MHHISLDRRRRYHFVSRGPADSATTSSAPTSNHFTEQSLRNGTSAGTGMLWPPRRHRSTSNGRPAASRRSRASPPHPGRPAPSTAPSRRPAPPSSTADPCQHGARTAWQQPLVHPRQSISVDAGAVISLRHHDPNAPVLPAAPSRCADSSAPAGPSPPTSAAGTPPHRADDTPSTTEPGSSRHRDLIRPTSTRRSIVDAIISRCSTLGRRP